MLTEVINPSSLSTVDVQSPGRLPVRMGYLGPINDHADNIARVLQARGVRLHRWSDSSTWGIYDHIPRLRRSMMRLWNQACGTRDSSYVRAMVEAVDERGLDCVIGYWGTAVLGDLIALKHHRPGVKVILNVLCHPTGLTHAKVIAQNSYFARAARCLDGLIVSSKAMQEYLKANVLFERNIPITICPPYYSKDFFPAERLPDCQTPRNLLFLGRMDWRRAQPCDNVGAFIDELLGCGVHVHHHESDAVAPHPKRRMFPYMPLHEVTRHATQFDASLLYYNLDACRRRERFDVTVPDRLVASVTAGIPIAIPARGYTACREYLRDYGAVIEFESAEELTERLADRQGIQRLREIARRNSQKYVAENRTGPLLDFIQRIVRSR